MIVASFVAIPGDARANSTTAPLRAQLTQDWLDRLVDYLRDLYNQLGGDTSDLDVPMTAEQFVLTVAAYQADHGVPEGLSEAQRSELAATTAAANALVVAATPDLESGTLTTLAAALQDVWSQLGLNPADLSP